MSEVAAGVVIEGEHTTAKVFVHNEGELDSAAMSQLYRMVNHPAFTQPIRVMPDVHAAKGVVVGFSMPLTERVVPQVVGTDIGCGMTAWRLGSDLPLSDEERDDLIREAVPAGGRDRDGSASLTAYPDDEAMTTFRQFARAYEDEFGERISPPFQFSEYDADYFDGLFARAGIAESSVRKDVGTTGGGNHFLEFGESERTGDYWLVVHSGSRRLGKAVAKHWQERAGGHPRLGWLEGEDAHGYFVDMIACQAYARWNRRRMGEAALNAIGVEPEESFDSTHNYIDFKDLVIRKGATRAHEGERVVVPIDPASGILICEGEGNPNANRSAPHGAGRVLSRGDAKQMLGSEDFENALGDVYARHEKTSVAEAPQAYKDAEYLLDRIGPLAEPVDLLRPIHNIKHS